MIKYGSDLKGLRIDGMELDMVRAKSSWNEEYENTESKI